MNSKLYFLAKSENLSLTFRDTNFVIFRYVTPLTATIGLLPAVRMHFITFLM